MLKLEGMTTGKPLQKVCPGRQLNGLRRFPGPWSFSEGNKPANPIRVIREIYHAVVPRLRDEGGWRRPIRG